jgi:hypothetical protein
MRESNDFTLGHHSIGNATRPCCAKTPAPNSATLQVGTGAFARVPCRFLLKVRLRRHPPLQPQPLPAVVQLPALV